MPLLIDKTRAVVLTKPYSSSSEAYRTLRINIDFSCGSRPIQTLAVASCIRGEGRTTTALNLAVVYAQAGKRVALMDADLRNPSLHLFFDGDNLTGLTNYLSGNSTMNEIVKPTNIDNLFVITSGPPGGSPSELLASARMNQLCHDAKSYFDIILFDIPPMLGCIDAKIVASKSDGVVLVVERGQVKRAIARKAKEELTSVGATLLGVALNRIPKKEAGGYR